MGKVLLCVSLSLSLSTLPDKERGDLLHMADQAVRPPRVQEERSHERSPRRPSRAVSGAQPSASHGLHRPEEQSLGQ